MQEVYCFKCGAGNPANSRFCARCGSSIDKAVEYVQPLSNAEKFGFGAFVFLMPGLGTLGGIIMGMVWTIKKRPGGVGFLIYSVAMGMLFWFLIIPILIAFPNYGRTKKLAQEAEVKSNLHSIQISIERYAVDHEGSYPEDVNDVVSLGFVDAFPPNPLGEREATSGTYRRPAMKPVPDGEFSAGDFVYEPIKDPEGRVYSYVLKVYGASEEKGFILELSGYPDG